MNKYTPIEPTGLYELQDAVTICKLVEPVAEQCGWHIGLTGGTLYGEGGRKDIDLVFYRIRQVEDPCLKLLFEALDNIGMTLEKDHGFCKKFLIGGVIPIDALFPEDWVGDYPLQHLMIETGKVET